MSEAVQSLYEFRLEQAKERGFIPREDATETQIARGLEDMHEAPFDKDGPFIGAVALSSEMQAS